MGFRFRKRIGLLGGLFHLNLSRGGVSVSAGPKGANVNFDLSGRRKHPRATVGIPGTGLFYQTALKGTNDNRSLRDLLAGRDYNTMPIQEKAKVMRDALKARGHQEYDLASIADQILIDDGKSIDERWMVRAWYVREMLREREPGAEGTDYPLDIIANALKTDPKCQLSDAA